MIYRIIHYLAILGIISLSFISGMLFFAFQHQWVDFSALEHYNPGKPSILLDEDGHEWTRFQLDRREIIKYNDIPEKLIEAFVAAEDWEFFNHVGISVKGILRSIVVNLYNGSRVQGASTITQQLVKLLFFDSQKTFSRKIKEQFCALAVERQFTKEQIMETYLNHVYFGCGIYGVQAASQRYWGKNVQELSLDQMALLAANVNNPSNYCPLLCPLSAQRRANMVLRKMERIGFINEKACQNVIDQPLNLYEHQEQVCAPHLKEALRIQLEELFGKQRLYSGGLTIQTTLNQCAQRKAQEIFGKQCAELCDTFHLPLDGALIAIESKTGQIKALVGGRDFKESKFNRALQARRQVGSTFKPVVYAAAIEHGKSFADTQIDEPMELIQNNNSWKPKNWNRKFNGQITLAYALSHSNNIVSIKTLLDMGYDRVINLAKKCRLQGPFHKYPSLALGCVDATLKQVVGMFNVFTNNGVYVEPHCLRWVKDEWGTKIYKSHPETEKVMSSLVSGQVAKVLSHGIERVKEYYKDEWFSADAISKTGTTNDSRTCWFVGSTPHITTAVYIGADDNRSMGANVYPIRTAFPIWLAFNKVIHHPVEQFMYDPSLHEIIIHEKTGKLLALKNDPEAIAILI